MSDQLKDEAFGKWWVSAASCGILGRPEAHRAWNAAWTCAKLGQWEAVKAEVHAELRQYLTNYAVELFKARDPARARTFLDLADERHDFWAKNIS